MVSGTNFILLCWFIFFAYWFIKSFSVKKTMESTWKNQSHYRIIGAVIMITIVLVIHPESVKFHIFDSIAPLSLSFVAIGLLIAIIARHTLGDNWSAGVDYKKDHKLITTGIYSIVRNPIYTGALLMVTGAVMYFQNLITFIIFIPVFILLFYKIHEEEKLMLKHFPKEYPKYKKKVKALIPFIY